jgi:hypothetical protein
MGYSGSYDKVAAFVCRWREEQRFAATNQVYVPLEFAAVEGFQFDWGENYASIDGRKIKLQVVHFKLSHSRAFISDGRLNGNSPIKN